MCDLYKKIQSHQYFRDFFFLKLEFFKKLETKNPKSPKFLGVSFLKLTYLDNNSKKLPKYSRIFYKNTSLFFVAKFG
jgi:hypothetical protein